MGMGLIKFILGIYINKTKQSTSTLIDFTSGHRNSNVTRFAFKNNFILLKVLTNYGNQNVYFRRIPFWNTIALNIKTSRTPNDTKNKLKKYTMSLTKGIFSSQ